MAGQESGDGKPEVKTVRPGGGGGTTLGDRAKDLAINTGITIGAIALILVVVVGCDAWSKHSAKRDEYNDCLTRYRQRGATLGDRAKFCDPLLE